MGAVKTGFVNTASNLGNFLGGDAVFGNSSAGAKRAENRNNASDSVNDYWDRTQDANKNLKNDVTGYSNQFENNTNQYVGNQGYQNALNQAQKGAISSANQAGASAAGTARSMGMSKGAAAAMGSGQTINAYNQGLANQQNQVQGNYTNALNQQNNIYSTKSNMANQVASNQINAAGQDVANRINMFNAAYNNQDMIEKLHTGVSGFGK